MSRRPQGGKRFGERRRPSLALLVAAVATALGFAGPGLALVWVRP